MLHFSVLEKVTSSLLDDDSASNPSKDHTPASHKLFAGHTKPSSTSSTLSQSDSTRSIQVHKRNNVKVDKSISDDGLQDATSSESILIFDVVSMLYRATRRQRARLIMVAEISSSHLMAELSIAVGPANRNKGNLDHG
jgi:hypothetical protein